MIRPKLSLLTGALFLTGCQAVYQPVAMEERKQQLNLDLASIFAYQEPLEQTLSLEEAMARAVVYNLEQRVKTLETTIARQAAGLATYSQLPKLNLFVNNAHRSKETTFDQDRDQTNADLTLAWNVLDFGVSYIRSRQEANRALITEERRKKSAAKLLIQTHNAYWRALAANKLEQDIRPLQAKLEQALKNARIAEQRRLQPPLELLDYQKALLEILSQLQRLQKELMAAKIDLARLVNVNPGQPLKLQQPENLVPVRSKLPPINKLEQYALLHRPELKETHYQRRIKADETRKAMLRMLPGLEFRAGEQYNSGDSYVNNVWAEAGLQITWNLMNLLSGPKNIELSESQEKIQELRSLALHISVMTQVQVAYRQLQETSHSYKTAKTLGEVANRIFKHTSAGRQAVKLSEMELIRRQADQVLFKIKQHLAYAELQAAQGEFYITLGEEFLPENASQLSVTELKQVLGKKLSALQAGTIAGMEYADYSVARPTWIIKKSSE